MVDCCYGEDVDPVTVSGMDPEWCWWGGLVIVHCIKVPVGVSVALGLSVVHSCDAVVASQTLLLEEYPPPSQTQLLEEYRVHTRCDLICLEVLVGRLGHCVSVVASQTLFSEEYRVHTRCDHICMEVLVGRAWSLCISCSLTDTALGGIQSPYSL